MCFTCDKKHNFHFVACFDKAVESLGALDIVINNAGIMNDADWEPMIDVNYVREEKRFYCAKKKKNLLLEYFYDFFKSLFFTTIYHTEWNCSRHVIGSESHGKAQRWERWYRRQHVLYRGLAEHSDRADLRRDAVRYCWIHNFVTGKVQSGKCITNLIL